MADALLVDFNNIGFAAHNSPKLIAGDLETQAVFNSLRMLRGALRTYRGFTPIVLWDGRSWRHKVLDTYKSNRDDTPEKRAHRDAYKAQKPYIIKSLKALGVPQMMALNLEADDLAGMLTGKLLKGGHTVVLLSGDTDWLQLVQAGVIWHDPINDRIVNHRNFETFTELPSPRAYLEAKALIGDESDKITGIDGLGKKAAERLIGAFGSVQGFFDAAAAPDFFDKKKGALPAELSRFRKKLIAFATPEGKAIFDRNIDLMDLRSPLIPKPERLTRTVQKLDIPAFREVCEELAFHSILKDMDAWLEPFQPKSLKEAA